MKVANSASLGSRAGRTTRVVLIGMLGCAALLCGQVGWADDCTPILDPDPRACEGTHSLVITQRYLLAVHAAEPGATFAEHETHLLESADGSNWTEVSGWQPYVGSVPEVIERDGFLYLFNPGKRRVYDLAGGSVTGASVSISDAIGNTVSYVDPSAIVDDEDRMVLFFLNSTGVPPGTDPAAGSDPKAFDSATEDASSNGLAFTLEPGPRVEALSSDPDVFYDGSRYVLYISYGSNTRAYESATLHGSYTGLPGLGPDAMLTSVGGVPAGHYDADNVEYWTYVHAHAGGANVVRHAVHASLDSALTASNFVTVVQAADLGLDSATSIESASFFDRGASSIATPLPGLAMPALWIFAVLAATVGVRDLVGRGSRR